MSAKNPIPPVPLSGAAHMYDATGRRDSAERRPSPPQPAADLEAMERGLDWIDRGDGERECELWSRDQCLAAVAELRAARETIAKQEKDSDGWHRVAPDTLDTMLAETASLRSRLAEVTAERDGAREDYAAGRDALDRQRAEFKAYQAQVREVGGKDGDGYDVIHAAGVASAARADRERYRAARTYAEHMQRIAMEGAAVVMAENDVLRAARAAALSKVKEQAEVIAVFRAWGKADLAHHGRDLDGPSGPTGRTLDAAHQAAIDLRDRLATGTAPPPDADRERDK